MSGENYPKWVTPHASHITLLKDGRQIAQKWDNKFAVNSSTGAIAILVNNKDEENKATAQAT